MDQVLPSQSPASGMLEDDSEELQLRVDFFRKLGYTPGEVMAALRKLGLSADTNAVLGELVSSRASSGPGSDSDEKTTSHKDTLLPPSWAAGPCKIPPQPGDQNNADTELRPIVIDGSNVAMSHGNKEVFSCRGIQLAVNFFLDRGHNTITVFVPSWRKEHPRADSPITDQHILMEFEKQKIVVFTPSRRVGGKRVVCYDDRFIVKLAYESDGVIVSNDTYRDLQGERPEWKKCIEERLLMYSFVNDKFMPPDDPLGRHGPNLDNFLRKKPLPTEQKRQLCPYGKKCTYGIKCKFNHPERANQSYLSLADELREKAQISERNGRQLQYDPGPAHNAYSHSRDTKNELIREQQSCSRPGQVSENKLLYREDPRGSPNRLYLMPNHYYANLSHEYLDSGLGSFESQYSDISPSNSHGLRPQQLSTCTESNHASVLLEKKHTSQSCRSCSHEFLSTAHQQLHGKTDYKGQPNYDSYPPYVFPSGVPHQHHSHHSQFHCGDVPHLQQKYWSDPFQGLPQTRTSSSLPAPNHSTPCHASHCSYNGHQYHSWGQPQRPSAAFDPQRLELRKKLQAIFNPYQVDTVMEMFPHLMDAEKLAVQILNLKAQSGIF